jgi:hypothetical protein
VLLELLERSAESGAIVFVVRARQRRAGGVPVVELLRASSRTQRRVQDAADMLIRRDFIANEECMPRGCGTLFSTAGLAHPCIRPPLAV